MSDLFSRIADDPGRMRHRRDLLQRLASNKANPAIAEMARDLLSARTTPRQVLANSAYAEEFNKAIGQFGSWYRRLSDEERDAVWQEERQRLDVLAEQELAEQANQPSPPRRTIHQEPESTEDEETPESWLE